MLVADCTRAELARRLRGPGIHLDTGAFTTHLTIDLPDLVDEFAWMYGAYRIDEPAIDDFRVRIGAPSLLRRFVRPQAQSWIEGETVVEPLPRDQGMPCLESGLNIAIALTDVVPLVVHSAVLERDGRALVLPAPSGSGKSTLCAALAWRGWRLLSDEATILCFETGEVLPNPRPVSLKNTALDVIAAYEPRARFSRVYRGTSKGNVTYMQPPPEAVARAGERAAPGLIVAPVYRAGAQTTVREMDPVAAFRWLIDNSINYSSMLQTGFDLLADFVERSRPFALDYSDLDDAIDTIDRLHRGAAVRLAEPAHEIT